MNLVVLTIDTFSPHAGSRFTLDPADGTAPLELLLATIEPWGPPPAPGTAQRQPFTLTFSGPVEPLLPQATYRLDHQVLGPHDIFIVPIGRDAGGTRYEAVFS